MKKTKIIVTLGPAVEKEEKMYGLIKAGIDIARINTAHGDMGYHKMLVDNFRQASQRANQLTAIMLDIKGPEIRTGEVENGEIALEEGRALILTSAHVVGTGEKLHISYPYLFNYLHKGDIILLGDGEIKLKVFEIKQQEITTKVIQGGKIKSRRGVNIKGKTLPIPYLRKKDIAYLDFAMKYKIDFIAASFIRNASDVYSIKKRLNAFSDNIPIVAKIETQGGLKYIDDILLIVDGIMVARGDLGVEIAVENLPEVQKYLLNKALVYAKPAIIATQMLETMIEHPIPTRAEVSDIANAILDGADALMLSGETAIGKYPKEAVETLVKVAKKAEDLLFKNKGLIGLRGGISHHTSNAAVSMAREMEADAILCLTRSGKTARLVSKHRSSANIIVVTYNDKVLRRTTLLWGTKGFVIKKLSSTDEVTEIAIQTGLNKGYIGKGNLVIITCGEPSGIPGTTNVLRVHLVGNILGRGIAFGKKCIKGRVCLLPDIKPDCDIVVCKKIPKTIASLSLKGIISESEIFHPKIVQKMVAKNITIIVGVKGILKKVEVGQTIFIDPYRAIVFR